MRIGIALILSFGLTVLSCITSTGCSRVNYAILGLLVGEAIYDDPAPENVQPETDPPISVDPTVVDVRVAVDVDNDGASVVADAGGPDGNGSVSMTINVEHEHDNNSNGERTMDPSSESEETSGRNRPPDNRPPDRDQDDGDAPGRGNRQDNQGHDHEAHDGHRNNAGGPSG